MIYRPFMAALLYLRLEEYGQEISDVIVTTKNDPQTLTLPSGFTLSPVSWEPIGKQNEVTISGQPTKTLWLSVVPSQARWLRNEAMEADTLDLYFDLADLPIDPRIIRSLGVAFFAGMYKDGDFEAMMQGGEWPDYIFKNENLRFSGFADEIKQTGEELSIKCRDMTGILIDTQVPTVAYRDIVWEGYIEDVIASVVRTLPAFDRIPILCRDFDPGTIKFEPHIRQKIPTRKKGESTSSKPRKARRAPKIKQEKYWDLLTDIAVQSGFVIYCDVRPGDSTQGPVTRIVLTQADSLFNEYNKSLTDYGDYVKMTDAEDTFLWWNEPSGRSTSTSVKVGGRDYNPQGMLFIHGDNLSVCDYTRNLSDAAVATIELVCQDGNKIIRSQFPKKGTNPMSLFPTAIWAQDKVKVFVVSGIVGVAGANGEVSIEDALYEAAKQTFYALGKGEMELHLETAEMTSSSGIEGIPDVLNLKAGFPIEVLHAAGNDQENFDSRVDFAGMSEKQFADYLKKKWPKNEAAANAIANAMLGQGKALAKDTEAGQNLLTRVWFTKKADFNFSAESFTVSIDAVNYVTPRITAWIKKEST